MRRAAIGRAAAAVAVVLPLMGAGAAPSSGPLPSLPWGAVHTGLSALAGITAPLRAVWQPILEGATQVPGVALVARPAEASLDLIDASLPLAVTSTGLLQTLDGAWPTLASVGDAQAPAWQVSAIPDIAGAVTSIAAQSEDLRAAVDSAVSCDCMGDALTARLSSLAATLHDAAPALAAAGPLSAQSSALLGYDAPRTYLLVIGNQAEMRPSGGAPLYAAVVTAEDGLVRIADKGTTSTHFFPPMNQPVTWTGVDGNPYYADNPRTMPFVNAGANPDFAVSAQEMAAAFAAGDHPPVDGVVYVDLSLLTEVLRLTGPIDVPGLGSVTSDTLVTQLLDSAYDGTTSVEDNAQRQAANDALFEALLTRMSAGVPMGDGIDVLRAAAAGRHLQLWFEEPATQGVFEDLGWAGRVVAPADGDWMAWYTQSGNPSKTDIRSARRADRTVQVAHQGVRVTTQYVVENQNDAGSGTPAEEKRGYQATWMRTGIVIYLPRGATNVAVTALDGVEAAPLPGARVDRSLLVDGAGNRFLRFVGWIEPHTRVSVTVAYDLPSDGRSYRVSLEPQAAITPYEAAIAVRGTDGTTSTWGPAPVAEPTNVDLPLAPSGR